MNAYMELARFYDRMTRDVDYASFLEFYRKIFRLYAVEPKTVLDLACGTGTLTMLMAEAGYEMIGVDASEDMLMQASGKSYELDPERRPMFLQQKMEELDLYGTVDAAVCSLDGFNYVPQPVLAETLRRLRLFIRPEGLLIFDVNSPEKLMRLDGEAFVDETEDVFCVWRGEYDAKLAALRYGMDLFIRCGKQWKREFEEHVEYVHTVASLQTLLQEAGFTDVCVFGDRVLSAPQTGTERIFVAATNACGK